MNLITNIYYYLLLIFLIKNFSWLSNFVILANVMCTDLVPVQMPNDRDQFDRDFDLLYREVQRLSSLLPLYLSVTKEEKVGKAVIMQVRFKSEYLGLSV